MKHLFYSLAIALASTMALPATAQDAPADRQPGNRPQMKPSIEGYWQLCTFEKDEKGEMGLSIAPVLKVMSKEGTYTDLIIKTTGGGTIIGESGTYKQTSDSTITLAPFSAPRRHEGGDAAPAQQEKNVKFRLQGPQWLVLDLNDANGNETHEIWMRVRFGMGAKEMLEQLKKGETPDLDKVMPRRGGRQDGQRPGARRGGFQGQRPQNAPDMPQNDWMNED